MGNKKLVSRWGRFLCSAVVIGMISSVGYAAEEVEVKKAETTEVKKAEDAVNQPVWYVSYDKALAESKKAKKPVFAFFTGSDWCSWCIRLHKEVLDKKDFLDWAKTKVVLLKIDFPRQGNLDAKQKAANDDLSKKFNVRGFPTVILLKDEGVEFARTGYRRGGEKPYITYLDQLLKKEAQAKADKKE